MMKKTVGVFNGELSDPNPQWVRIEQTDAGHPADGDPLFLSIRAGDLRDLKYLVECLMREAETYSGHRYL